MLVMVMLLLHTLKVITIHLLLNPMVVQLTGVGGVIRDILSAGTRPIAIFDGLRFGNIEKDKQAKWLFKNAVTGIADYGNCLAFQLLEEKLNLMIVIQIMH